MMRCPYCEKEMELGYLQNARPILWDKEALEIIIAPKKNRGFYVTKTIPFSENETIVTDFIKSSPK